MPTTATLCPGCFADKGDAAQCPHCGYDETARRAPIALPHRTLLNGQYLIGCMLGKLGGFGITYLAYHTRLKTAVAIKEYLPRDFAAREGVSLTVSAHSGEDEKMFHYGLDVFLREAQTLAQFDHPNIVRVRDVFEANNTAYLVMDYYQGQNFEEYLQQRGGRIDEREALAILTPVLAGLEEVHRRGFLHRDIKPANLYLTDHGRCILLDFGAARLAIGERSRSVLLTDGYAPPEQYDRRGKQGPWTDLYGFAAVLYRAVSGETPPSVHERAFFGGDALRDPAELPGLSAPFVEALRRGLAMKTENRPKDVQAFKDLLAAAPQPKQSELEKTRRIEHEAIIPPGPPPVLPAQPAARHAGPTVENKPGARRARWLAVPLMLAGVLALAAGAMLRWSPPAPQLQPIQAPPAPPPNPAPQPKPPPRLDCPMQMDKEALAGFNRALQALRERIDARDAAVASAWDAFRDIQAGILARGRPSAADPRSKTRALACLTAMALAGDGQALDATVRFNDGYFTSREALARWMEKWPAGAKAVLKARLKAGRRGAAGEFALPEGLAAGPPEDFRLWLEEIAAWAGLEDSLYLDWAQRAGPMLKVQPAKLEALEDQRVVWLIGLATP